MKNKCVYYKDLKKAIPNNKFPLWFKNNCKEGVLTSTVLKKLNKDVNYNNWQMYLFRIYKLSGVCKIYYRGLQLKGRLSYKNGKLDGLYELFYRNGDFKEESHYKKGILIDCQCFKKSIFDYIKDWIAEDSRIVGESYITIEINKMKS